MRGLFILFGCSFILRRGDFINVVSAVVGSNFVIFALFYQIFYGSLTLDSYGDLLPEGPWSSGSQRTTCQRIVRKSVTRIHSLLRAHVLFLSICIRM